MRPLDDTPRGHSCSHTECRQPAAPGELLCKKHLDLFKAPPRVPARRSCRQCGHPLGEMKPNIDAFCGAPCLVVYSERNLKPGDEGYVPTYLRDRQEYLDEWRSRNNQTT